VNLFDIFDCKHLITTNDFSLANCPIANYLNIEKNEKNMKKNNENANKQKIQPVH
jgi:hypothetical protein